MLAIIGILTAIDIIEDYVDSTSLRHLSLDIAIAAAAFVTAIYLIARITHERQRSTSLEKEKKILEDIASDLKQKSKIFIEGLSVQIDKEFTLWGLTSAEREIALFILKGLSTTEIAEIRSASEKTVRHQLAAVYKKAQIKGRQELQAYFLEDLLAPTSNSSGA